MSQGAYEKSVLIKLDITFQFRSSENASDERTTPSL